MDRPNRTFAAMGRNAAHKTVNDADLVAKAITLCGSRQDLAAQMRTSERALGAVLRGAALPAWLRPMVHQFVKNKGMLCVPAPPAQQGRKPSPLPHGGNLRIPLRPEEILAFEAQADRSGLTAGEAFASAVRRYLRAHRTFARDGMAGATVAGTVGYRCRLDLAVLKQLNRRCVFLGWRRFYLRAAVLEWTTAQEQQKGLSAHASSLRAVA
jgi:hypothetical protein